MSQEIVYTSSPQGLKLGSRGFCTVASTPGMASSLAERLESLSGYRHLYPPQDPQARLNPIAWSHLLLTVGGRRYHVLSRIADAGLDYSQRSNKLAHHVALETKELPLGGPAWCLAQEHFMLTAWNEPPRLLTSGRVPPRGEQPTSVCSAWQRIAGDAGWAGVLAQTADAKRDAYLLFSPGMDLLPLLVEAQSLLPPARRWEVSFSTYVTRLPPGVECRWRCVVADSDEALAARRAPGATVIDLTQPLGPAPAGPLVAAARTGKITFPDPTRPVEATPLTSAPRKPLAGLDTTPDADLLSDDDYRLADDRTIPGPPPPVQLKMGSTAASSGTARRLALLVGGVLGLLMLIGGAYAAMKYLGRALASLPTTASVSDTAADHEAHHAAVQDAITNWEEAVKAFKKETEAATLTKAMIDAVDEDANQATRYVEEITQLKVPEKVEALTPALAAYGKLVTEASELQKQEYQKADAIKAVQTNLLNGKNKLQAALEPAKTAVDNAQKKRDALKQLHQRAESQQKRAQELLDAKTELLKQQQQLSTANAPKLDDIRGQLTAATEQAAKDFADLEAWSTKLAAHREKLHEITKNVPAPPDSKPLQESVSALAAYESLAKSLTARTKELAKADPGEFLTKLPDNFLIDEAFPSKANRDFVAGTKHSGQLFPVPPAAEASFKISIPGRQDIFVKHAKTDDLWTVEKGVANSELTQPVGSFAISQGYLTWKWDREVNDSLHEMVVELKAGSKTRLVRLLTKPPQQHAALELAKDSEKQWRLKQPVFSIGPTKDLKIIVHRVEFVGLPDGFEMLQGPVVIKAEELKTEIGLQRKNSKPEKPRFAVVLKFVRQADKTTWKLRAEPLTLLIVPTNDQHQPQPLTPEHYHGLSDDLLAKFVFGQDSSKAKILRSIDEFPDLFKKNADALETAKKIKDETERNKAIEHLKKEKTALETQRSERLTASEQVFPSDLYQLVQQDRQAFIDNLAGSIKIHVSIVRHEKDKPSLTIAQFGDASNESNLQARAAAAPAAPSK